MNEKLQYASMLEIPVNTCSVTLKEGKKKKISKRKAKNHEAVKEELLNKINSEKLEENLLDQNAVQDELALFQPSLAEDDFQSSNVEETATVKPKARRKFKFSLITAQLIVIGILISTIFLTSALYADSGINVFFKNVFGSNQTESVDLRTHEQFTPVIAVGDMSDVTIEQGVMTFSGEGSVYSPCNGKVSAISQDKNGKYVFEIAHSKNFKSVISGLDYAYAELGDNVYSNIPVGYVNTDGATMCFKSGNDTLISNYQIIDGLVVWAV